MRKSNGEYTYSPSDLITFMESEFASWTDRFNLDFPNEIAKDLENPLQTVVAEKGLQHEVDYLEILHKDGRDVCVVPDDSDRSEITTQAMRQGREIIYQAALSHGKFSGFADFLHRTDGKSNLGGHSYEVWDTKLARKPKPYFLIQLCCYAEMLMAIQGHIPEEVGVVLGTLDARTFRTRDFLYYYRQLKQAFLAQQASFDPGDKPLPSGFDNEWHWQTHADELLEKSDHLSRVANITRVQIRRLEGVGISTMVDLAKTDLQHVWKMLPPTFKKLRHQARLQLESQGLTRPKYELIPPDEDNPRRGLALLPPASSGDVFFDIEGYPFLGEGLEYLWGAVFLNANQPEFVDWWAHDPKQENATFEAFVDWVHTRWQQDPAMHIYHYGHYEVDRLRRLMGRYGTQENEVDDLLRNEVLIDLYMVVRQSLRVGEPSYSLKNIERLYMEEREGDVTAAADSLVEYEHWLEAPDGSDWKSSAILKGIRDYNRQDCLSTWKLVEWFRGLQRENGIEWVPKPGASEEEGESGPEAHPSHLLATELLAEIPESVPEDSKEKWRVHELLAFLLEFHRREDKPVWWAMFDRHEMEEEQLIDDLACLGSLERTSQPPEPIKRSLLYEYQFDPNQDTKLAAGSRCIYAHDLASKTTIEKFDPEQGLLAVKLGAKREAPPNRLSLIPDEYVNAGVIKDSIFRTVQGWKESGDLQPALSDFLFRRRPRIQGNESGPLIPAGSDILEATARVVAGMEDTTLCIQGPPGTGKSYNAAHVIIELIRTGKRVGISSNSHKAINNLMDHLARAATKQKVHLSAIKVGGDAADPSLEHASIKHVSSFSGVDLSPEAGVQVVGATAWGFSREGAVGEFDYLFVDEAGQVSVANLVGMAASTRNIVLIGDQMQLSQPIQGSHPGESGLSCLDYLLQKHQTIPADLGIFLGQTWRMHPTICEFVSSAIYEGRLHSLPETENRVVQVPSNGGQRIKDEAGIVFVPVEHEGNTQGSEEEVQAILEISGELLGRQLGGLDGKPVKPLTLDDILFVAPYNMQVRMLRDALGSDARIGTIDKFQGQEAPVVVISMCSSDAHSSLRGLEFVLNRNRLNVAISRAQSLVIVVANEKMARARCNTMEQMRLVNLFCRIVQNGETDEA